jgi:hypothetical protein
MTDTATLLDDEAMRRFLVDGYLVVKTNFPRSVHDGIHQQLDTQLQRHGVLGNNLLPLIREVYQIFDDPAVRGALTGILGRGYLMHSHRYCHLNKPGTEGQNFHQDSYAVDDLVRHHRCRWAMAFYYPQDTTIDMGPTGILPASQYYETIEGAERRQEVPLTGEAGTVVIVHYDLWHRAMPNKSEQGRYMLKFLFQRLQEPRSPSWDNEDLGWRSPAVGGVDELEAACSHLWSWNCAAVRSVNGQQQETNDREDLEELMGKLRHEDEAIRLDAAYTLASYGAAAVPSLIEALNDVPGGEDDKGNSPAAIALAATGGSAKPALIETLGHQDGTIRAGAAFALGNIAAGDDAPGTVEALTRALSDSSEWVRRNAVEALGALGHPASETVAAMGPLLTDEIEWVRDNAARALAKIGPDAAAAVPALVASLRDENRYIRFSAAVALKQIDTKDAREALYEELLNSRWCPLTTEDSAY